MKRFIRGSLGTLLAASVLAGCTGGGSGGDSGAAPSVQVGSFDYFEMFVNLADNLIVPGYTKLQQQAQQMAGTSGTVASYCAAIGDANETAARDKARQSWRDAMAQLQRVNVHQIGPVTDNNNALQQRLITPAESRVSYCGIDQSVVLAQADGFDLASRLPNQKGMYAIEYLLFNDDLTHNCPVQIVETRNWNELNESQRRKQRCEHAARLVDDVAAAAGEAATAWRTDGGNYRATFAHPDNRATILKELSDALFYVELNVKDDKLGPPLGLHNSCNRVACPDRVKSPFSKNALANIDSNMAGFEAVFTGGAGLGLDDLINSANLPSVTARINTEVAEFRTYLASIQQPLLDQTQAMLISGDKTDCVNSAANPDTVRSQSACSAFGYLKRVTDTLRTDFVTALNVDLPDRAQSDND